jgi:hypothetical protein
MRVPLFRGSPSCPPTIVPSSTFHTASPVVVNPVRSLPLNNGRHAVSGVWNESAGAVKDGVKEKDQSMARRPRAVRTVKAIIFGSV